MISQNLAPLSERSKGQTLPEREEVLEREGGRLTLGTVNKTTKTN